MTYGDFHFTIFGFALPWPTRSGIWQVHWLDLGSINLNAKNKKKISLMVQELQPFSLNCHIFGLGQQKVTFYFLWLYHINIGGWQSMDHLLTYGLTDLLTIHELHNKIRTDYSWTSWQNRDLHNFIFLHVDVSKTVGWVSNSLLWCLISINTVCPGLYGYLG